MAYKRFNLLIIDDEIDFLTEMTNAFAYFPENEFNLETAQTSEAGLAKLRERRFDVVLIDLQMPNSQIGGLEIIQKLNEENIYLGVAIATGHEYKKEPVAAVNLGVQAWFDKPLFNNQKEFAQFHQRLKELAQVIPEGKLDEFMAILNEKR